MTAAVRKAQHSPHAGPLREQEIAAPPDPQMEHLIQLSMGGIGPQQPTASCPMHLCWPAGHPCGSGLVHIAGLRSEAPRASPQALEVWADG
jgi:hypothetical protein